MGGSGPELLLIRRAEVERDPWSGHVAVPGGRMDPGDPDLAATAVREMREETGIDLGAAGAVARHARRHPPPHARRSRLIVVRPYVAAVAGDTSVTPNREVAGYTWVPFAAFLDERNWGTAPIAVRTLGTQERPVFRYGGYQVWGMTEYMLRQLVTRYRQTD